MPYISAYQDVVNHIEEMGFKVEITGIDIELARKSFQLKNNEYWFFDFVVEKKCQNMDINEEEEESLLDEL